MNIIMSIILILYCLIFKWNRYSGSGQCIEHADLYKCVDFKMSLKRFQIFCVLSGCDYTQSLHGIGLNLAEKFVTQVGGSDLQVWWSWVFICKTSSICNGTSEIGHFDL